MSASHVEILEQRIVILEDTIQMLSYNLRCLNIRQGSQPVELPEKEAEMEVFNHKNMTVDLSGITALDRMYKLGQEQPNLKLPDLDFIDPEVRNMLGLNFVKPEPQFGADEEAWAK